MAHNKSAPATRKVQGQQATVYSGMQCTALFSWYELGYSKFEELRLSLSLKMTMALFRGAHVLTWSITSWLRADLLACSHISSSWCRFFSFQHWHLGLPSEDPSYRLAWYLVMDSRPPDGLTEVIGMGSSSSAGFLYYVVVGSRTLARFCGSVLCARISWTLFHLSLWVNIVNNI